MGLAVQDIPPVGEWENAVLPLVQKIVGNIPSGSQVLFVGSAHALSTIIQANASGLKVHAIDRSQEDIDFAQSFTTGNFQVVSTWDDYEPQERFDAVFGLHTLDDLGSLRTRSAIYRMADWLKRDGRLIVATALGGSSDGKSAQLLGLCQKAGLKMEKQVTHAPSATGTDQHVLFEFVKKEHYAIMGPYPLPESYRGPIELSEAAWKPFVERLNRDEFGFMLNVLGDNSKVLDVGSGYGKLPFELARRTGKAYSIEPNPDRNAIQEAKAREAGVEVAQGSAEKIPYPDAFFDATVAMWVMHYVDDLEQSLREMVRVTDRKAPGSKIVIVQGAPYNEVIGHINDSCMPLAASALPSHQGYLLHRAAEVFKDSGFGNISLHAVNSVCEFPEADLDERCRVAAEIIAGHWGLGEGNFGKMKESLMPQLKVHFAERPHGIGDQAAVLVARALAQ
ncbi:hypothetical protein CERZMDRAFT_59124 [Cercospora zeae-maydis SCOH1-5]|uniref:Methyltransferase type 11 domain-containing protein n=1 Tax=Cercospora zeae-maydis SCOH1-5 TaxID=717836 RepID=A0A6A6FFJ0_9PEZI|nr:hypothetical protein CERZMDRAFT_59124 [Cercospora zeae-maydis SCOH1-5]